MPVPKPALVVIAVAVLATVAAVALPRLGGSDPAPAADAAVPGTEAPVGGAVSPGATAAKGVATDAPVVPSLSQGVAVGGTNVVAQPRTPDANRVGVVLRVLLQEREVGGGRPVRARIQIENRTSGSVTLCDPDVDLARRAEILYRWREENRAATLPPGPVQPLDTARVVSLRPGESHVATLDLRPLLEAAAGFGEGPFAFRLAWRGDPSAVPAIVGAWNGEPGRVATSDTVVIGDALPEWFEKLGGDRETYHGVPSRVASWTPGAPAGAAVVDEVRAGGEPAVAALAAAADRMASRTPGASLRAGRSLEMLRALGGSALPVLRKVPAGPAVSMAIEVIEEDERERSRAAPAADSVPFRRAGGGDDGGTTFSATRTGPGATENVTWTFDRAGTFLVTRWSEGGGRSTSALPLAADRTVALKAALLRARPWAWRPVREERRAGEAEYAFALSDGSGRTLWSVTLRGGEAEEGNAFAASLLREFRAAAESGPAAGPSEGGAR